MKSGNTPRSRLNVQRAFTLIEIMIVIGVVGLVMAWGLPAIFRSLKKEGMRKAVSEIMEGCSHARAQAILQGVPAEFVIRAADGHMSVQSVTVSAGNESEWSTISTDNQPVPTTTPSAPIFSAKLSDDIAIQLLDVNFRDHMELDEAHVRFYPNGTSDEFTIVMQSTDGETRKISLEVVTGLAEMQVIK